jgi:putative ATPase
LGRGIGYAYSHDHPDGYVPQEYGVPRGQFYVPSDRGAEAAQRARLAELARRDQEAGLGPKPA